MYFSYKKHETGNYIHENWTMHTPIAALADSASIVLFTSNLHFRR